MAGNNGAAEARRNLEGIFKRRGTALIALAKKYSAVAHTRFLERQGTEQLQTGDFWTNITSQAAKGVFSFAGGDSDSAYFGLAHSVEYGKDLELGFNRRRESLRPVLLEVLPDFMEAAEKIYERG